MTEAPYPPPGTARSALDERVTALEDTTAALVKYVGAALADIAQLRRDLEPAPSLPPEHRERVHELAFGCYRKRAQEIMAEVEALAERAREYACGVHVDDDTIASMCADIVDAANPERLDECG